MMLPGHPLRPDKIPMLSSSRLARACTPRPCTQRCLVTRATFNSSDVNLTDVEAVAEKVTNAAESAVDTVKQMSTEMPQAASSHISGIVDRVKGISEDLYAGASSSVTAPSVDMSQLASYSEKASQFSADVISQSSKLADKLSGVMSEQFDALPEYQAQLAEQLGTLRGVAEDVFADAADASGAVSRQVMTEIVPRVSSELQSFSQLAADGHYADAATSPAGIAAAGASVLLLGGLTAAASSSSPTSSSPTSSSRSSSPADSRASAEAWIAQWRAKNAPQQASPSSSPQSPTNGYASSSGSSSDDSNNPAAAAANPSSNGAFSSNGAAPAAASASRSMDMTIAEYVSGDASSGDDGAAGGWYVTSDSEAEDSPYSEMYTMSNGGGATATETAPEVPAQPPAPVAASGSESGSADTDTEASAAGTATLAGACR